MSSLNNKPQPWEASKNEIKQEFEENRRCLLNSCHTYVQTHTLLLISLIIGLFATFVTFNDVFISYGLAGISFILIVGFVILVFAIRAGLRTIYWSILASEVIILPIDLAISNFNNWNKDNANKKCTYYTEAPSIMIILIGVVCQIGIRYDEEFNILNRWAIKTSGKSLGLQDKPFWLEKPR